MKASKKGGGDEACKSLKEDPATAMIPVIQLSALDTDKDKLMMYELGTAAFLVKPVEKDDIIAKIEKHCIKDSKSDEVA